MIYSKRQAPNMKNITPVRWNSIVTLKNRNENYGIPDAEVLKTLRVVETIDLNNNECAVTVLII